MPVGVSFDEEPFPGDPFVDPESGKNVNDAITDGGVPRNLRIYGGTITSIVMTDVNSPPFTPAGDGHDGATTGNSTAQMVVSFVANGPAVQLVWSGHLAYSQFWNAPGDPDGAGEVSGRARRRAPRGPGAAPRAGR